MIRLINTTLLLLICFHTIAISQEDRNSHFCRAISDAPSISNYQDYASFVHNFLNKSKSRSSANPDTIPVQLYMFTKTDGSERGDPQVIIDLLAQSNEYFRGAGFIFNICEQDIEFVNDDYFFEYNVDQKGDSLRRTYNKADALELYVVNTVAFDDGDTVAGIGSGISLTGGYTVCDYNSIGVGVLTHELGHCMHLAHTHGKFNSNPNECEGIRNDTGFDDLVVCKGAVRYDNRPDIDENNDGISDCLQTGDNVCDTPAEPQLGMSDMVDLVRDVNGEYTCTYIGTVRDPYGDVYKPELGNFMAYGRCRETHFSNGQLAKMRYALENSGLHFLCGACRDHSEPITRTITNTNDGTVGSLRWALSCASLSTAPVSIQFDLHDNDSIIYLERPLPILIGDVIIDGRLKNGKKITLDGSLMDTEWNSGIVFSGNILDIKNIRVQNFPYHGIYISDGASFLNFDNCEIKGCSRLSDWGIGIVIESTTGDINFKELIISQNKRGVNINEAQNISIHNTIIQDNERSSIDIDSLGNLNIEYIQVNNNGDGIYVNKADSVLIKNASFNNGERNGVDLRSTKTAVLENIEVIGNKYNGIFAVGTEDIKLHKLTITENGAAGINIQNFSSCSIDDASSDQNNTGLIFKSIPEVLLTNFTANNNTSYGIDGTEGGELIGTNITILNNERDGINIDSLGNLSLENLKVNNNSDGIHVGKADSVLIRNSFFNNGERNGIYLRSTKTTVLENIEVIGNEYTGIFAVGTEDIKLHKLTITDNGGTGINIQNFSSCSIDACSSDQNNTGLIFKSIPEVSLTNFTANNNTSYGIDGTEGGELIGTNITILNNKRDGINIDSLGKLILENIQVNENNDGIFVGKVDSILLKNASVNQGKRSGINVQAANIVELEHVEIIANKNTGLFIKGESALKLHNLIVNKNESTGINIQDFKRCDLDSLSLDENNSGLFFKNIANINFHNSTVSNHKLKAINGVDCGDLISSKLIVENNGGFGLHFNQLEKIAIYDIEFKKNSRGVYIEKVDSVNIKEVAVIENTGTGFSLSGILDGNIRNVRSIQNEGSGIYLKGEGNILLNDAEVIGNKNTGVALQDFVGGKIERLQINGNFIGLSLTETQTIQLDSLDITENKDRGISAANIGMLQGTNIQIADNGNYGIYVNSADEINLIQSFINNNERGFTIKSIADFTISEVDILYNKSSGLTIEEVSTADLRNLISSNNTGSGIVINAVETIDLDQIEIENNKGSGLFIAGKNILTISNTFTNNNTETGISLRNFLSASINDVVADSNRTGLYIDGITSLQVNNLNAAQNNARGIDWLNGNQVLLKNSTFLNNGGTGLSFNKISKIELSDIKSNSNGWAGIYIKEASEVDLNGLFINNNEKYGLEIIESSNLQLFNTGVGNNKSGGFICRMCNTGKIGDLNKPNWFYNNDGVGVTFSSGSTNIDLYNNQIGLDMEDTIGSNQSGIFVTGGSNNITIGGEIEELKNKIVNHPNYGLTVSSNVYDTQININEFSCNDNGIIIYTGGNNGIKRPTINPIGDRYGLSGTADSGSKVSIYKTSADCTSCEGESFLVNVTSNGDWRHIFDEPMGIGDKFTVISTSGKNSSSFSACQTFECSPSFQPSINDTQVSNLCEGDTLMLVAKGGTQYNWSNGTSSAENNIYAPGTYEVTVTGEFGCQSVVAHEVVLEAIPDFSIEDSGDESNCLGTERTLTVLGGLNYLWDTGDTSQIVVIDTFREYTVTVTSNGCSKKESILVNGQTPISVTTNQIICQGESYESYTETGVYEDVFLRSNGCDSIRVLELEVRSKTENTINQTICEGEDFEGYKESGVYEDTFAAINGCDSLRTIVLEILPSTTSTTVQTICAGTSFEGYSATGTYHDSFTASNGCDSIRLLELIVIDKVENRIEQVLCAGEAYLGYDISGTYEDTFMGESGCDSTRILELTILSENKVDITQSICEGETYEEYESSGEYIDTFTSENGCDSIRTLRLTVLSKQVNEFSEKVCIGEDVEGYKESGRYEDTFAGANGCDSVRILVLEILPTATHSMTQVICAGTSFEGYSTQGVYEDSFTASNGCDSIRTLELTIVDQLEVSIEQTICAGETYLGYQESGIYEDNFKANSGCDSTRILNLTILPENTIDINQNICEGESYEGYDSSGNYIDSFISSTGCDSIRTLTLTVNSSQTNEFSRTICSGESVEGYTSSNQYIDVFQSSNGCDSTRILNLIVNEIIETEETVNICAGTSHEGYMESGIYTDTYSSQNGCDSIRTLTIEVTEVARINEEVIICEGESYKGYSEPGIYVEEFSSSDCDTIYNLNLEVAQNYEVTIEKNICTGQSYEGYSESGDYTDRFLSWNGCDSIRHLQLISADRIITEMDTSICKGESVEGYFEKGSYIDIFQSQTGCDSLRILDVNILSENNAQCLMTNTIDLDISNYVSIYPNPTNALIRLDFLENRNPANTITLSIFDTQGILLLNRTMNIENSTINLEGIPAGLHIVLIDTGEAQYFKRIVKL